MEVSLWLLEGKELAVRREMGELMSLELRLPQEERAANLFTVLLEAEVVQEATQEMAETAITVLVETHLTTVLVEPQLAERDTTHQLTDSVVAEAFGTKEKVQAVLGDH